MILNKPAGAFDSYYYCPRPLFWWRRDVHVFCPCRGLCGLAIARMENRVGGAKRKGGKGGKEQRIPLRRTIEGH